MGSSVGRALDQILKSLRITDERNSAEPPVQIASLQPDVVPNVEIRKGVEPRLLFLVLLNEPYLIAAKQVLVKQVRFVRGHDQLLAGAWACFNEESQKGITEVRVEAPIEFV